MSYDLSFMPKRDDQTWDEAVDDAEAAAEQDDGRGADPADWERIVAAARELLGDVELFERAGDFELTHRATGIQLGLYANAAGITVPFWYEGERASEVMALAFRLGAVVEQETGLQGYDSQLGMSLADAAEHAGVSATFDEVASSFDALGLRPSSLPPAAVQRRPWWRFW